MKEGFISQLKGTFLIDFYFYYVHYISILLTFSLLLSLFNVQDNFTSYSRLSLLCSNG